MSLQTPHSSKKFASTLQPLVIKIEQVPDTKVNFDWWSLAPAGLAALVAFAGWVVVERFARARERRADLRALTNSFRDAIDDIVGDATKYYQIDGSRAEANSLATSIKAKTSLLSEHLNVIEGSGLNLNVMQQMKEFRKTLTGGEFESFNRKASTSGSKIFIDMAAAGQALNRSVQISLYRDLVKNDMSIIRTGKRIRK